MSLKRQDEQPPGQGNTICFEKPLVVEVVVEVVVVVVVVVVVLLLLY